MTLQILDAWLKPTKFFETEKILGWIRYKKGDKSYQTREKSRDISGYVFQFTDIKYEIPVITITSLKLPICIQKYIIAKNNLFSRLK